MQSLLLSLSAEQRAVDEQIHVVAAIIACSAAVTALLFVRQLLCPSRSRSSSSRNSIAADRAAAARIWRDDKDDLDKVYLIAPSPYQRWTSHYSHPRSELTPSFNTGPDPSLLTPSKDWWQGHKRGTAANTRDPTQKLDFGEGPDEQLLREAEQLQQEQQQNGTGRTRRSGRSAAKGAKPASHKKRNSRASRRLQQQEEEEEAEEQVEVEVEQQVEEEAEADEASPEPEHEEADLGGGGGFDEEEEEAEEEEPESPDAGAVAAQESSSSSSAASSSSSEAEAEEEEEDESDNDDVGAGANGYGGSSTPPRRHSPARDERGYGIGGLTSPMSPSDRDSEFGSPLSPQSAEEARDELASPSRQSHGNTPGGRRRSSGTPSRHRRQWTHTLLPGIQEPRIHRKGDREFALQGLASLPPRSARRAASER